MATHLVTTSPNSFDLPMHISEIPQPDLAASLMQGLAKSVDFTIINAARQLFKQVRTDIWLGDCSLDTLAELSMALNEQEFAEASFHAAGIDNTGCIQTIQSLWPIREDWTDQARDLTSLTYNWEQKQNRFEPKDIEEQIREPEANTSKKTIGRITRQVERKAADLGIDDADKAKTLANRIKREAINNANMVSSMKETSNGVLHMLHAALRLEEIDPTRPDFHLLPYPLRYKLISDVIRTAELQSEWACKNNRMSDDEFDTFDMLCSKTIKTLRAVINSPAFKVAMAASEASETQTG